MAKVILIDEKDNPVGRMEKLLAHQKGLLHRAFSIFIFNSKGEILLQKRAKNKYHSPGLWSNACCSHPVSKNIQKEAEKRLEKEMGIKCPLQKVFCLAYDIQVGKDLTECELDHIFIGYFNGKPKINTKEVEDYRWIAFEELKKDIAQNPQKYTPWLKIILKKLSKPISFYF